MKPDFHKSALKANPLRTLSQKSMGGSHPPLSPAIALATTTTSRYHHPDEPASHLRPIYLLLLVSTSGPPELCASLIYL